MLCGSRVGRLDFSTREVLKEQFVESSDTQRNLVTSSHPFLIHLWSYFSLNLDPQTSQNTNILAGTSSLFINKCHYVQFLPKDSFKYYKVLLCILSIACQCKESTPAISVVWCCFTQILDRFLGGEARGFLSATVNDTGR